SRESGSVGRIGERSRSGWGLFGSSIGHLREDGWTFQELDRGRPPRSKCIGRASNRRDCQRWAKRSPDLAKSPKTPESGGIPRQRPEENRFHLCERSLPRGPQAASHPSELPGAHPPGPLRPFPAIGAHELHAPGSQRAPVVADEAHEDLGGLLVLQERVEGLATDR